MAIDKGLYELPQGMPVPVSSDGAAALDIVIELPDGGAEIIVMDDNQPAHDDNLADFMEDDDLAELADELMALVQSDIDSRAEWAETYVEGLDVLGLKYEERTEPWDGACGAYSNVLAEAAIRFQAETMSETFPAAGPVKTKIIGQETRQKQQAAERVRADMNYELTERMIEYRPEHERMLYSLGLAGSAFKKVYFDPTLDRQTAVYLPAEDVIVPYGASHIWSAERVTHIMRKTEVEVDKLQRMGFYRDCDLGEPEPYHTDIEEKKAEDAGIELNEDNRYAIYEIHVDTTIEQFDGEDSVAKPYVISIEYGTNKVLAIRRNWQENDPKYTKQQYFVHYVYVPGFGFYGLGLIHIVGGYSRAGTSLIRQLVDAGTLSNLPGGLKSRELRVKGDDGPIAPGEWKDVDVPSGAIKDHLIPMPYGEPSPTLLALLEQITSEGRRLGAISDMNISDMSAQAPVGTTLALLERTLKPMAAVQARVHYAMKQEFKLLKAIIAEHAPPTYNYQPQTGEPRARREDYAMVEVIPVSDPNSSTMAQRVVQYQAVIQLAEKAPQIYDLPQLHRQMIEVLGVKNAEKLVPLADDQKPRDPVSENMGVLVGKPLKAFIYQDHDAHMAAHMSFMQDPAIMGAIGQNPQAKSIMAALQAHIAEHLAFNYRKQIEEKLGAPLPVPEEELPEEIEVQLSRLVADAGKQLAQTHQKQAAQQKAQQEAQDPHLQLERMDKQTKQMEVQRKAAKDQADAQLRKDEQARKRQKDYVDAQLRKEEIADDRRSTQVEAEMRGIELQNEREELDKRIKLDALEKLANMSNNQQNADKSPPEGNNQ